jgi:hypothetical protein
LAGLFPVLALSEESDASYNTWDSRWTLDTGYPPFVAVNYWAGLFETFTLAKLRNLNREIAPYEHGYIRPHIRLMSSVKVNQIEPRFDLYPFTFLGLTGGWSFMHRSLSEIEKFKDYTKYDCKRIGCDGWTLAPFIEGKFKWGYGDFFGVFFLRRDWAWAKKSQAIDSYDSTSALPFRSSFDHLNQFWLISGMKLSGSDQIMARYRYQKWAKSKWYRRDVSLIYMHSLNQDWTAGLEVNRSFRSDGFHSNTLALRLSWSLRKTPAAEDVLN